MRLEGDTGDPIPDPDPDPDPRPSVVGVVVEMGEHHGGPCVVVRLTMPEAKAFAAAGALYRQAKVELMPAGGKGES